MKEKRKNPRIGVPFTVDCILSPREDKTFYTASRDVSTGGIKILCESPLPPGKNMELDINLITETIVTKAKIMWCRKMPHSNKYYAGLKFLEVSEKNKRSIEAFLGTRSPS